MSIMISLITVIVLLIFAILRTIDWRSLASRWVGYNPERAKVCVREGMRVRVGIGKRVWSGVEGQMYVYKHKGDKYSTVCIVPLNYPHVENEGYRLIGVTDGRVVADPLGLFDELEQAKYHESVTDISAIDEGNTMVKAIRSVKTNKLQNIMTYILIAAVVAGAMWYFFGRNKDSTSSVSANQTLAITNNVTAPESGPTPGKVVPYNPENKVIP